MLSAFIDGRKVVRGSRMFSQVHGWGSVASVEWGRIRFLPDDPRYRHWYAFDRHGHHVNHYNGQVLYWSDRKDGDKAVVKPTKGVPVSVVNQAKGQEVAAVKTSVQTGKQAAFYQMVYKDKNGRYGISKAHYQTVEQAQVALNKVLPGVKVLYGLEASKMMVKV